MDVYGDDQWRRRGYPLQTSTEGSRPQYLATPSRTLEDSSPSTQPLQNPELHNKNELKRGDRDLMEAPTVDPMPRNSSRSIRQKDSILSFKLPGTWPRDPSPIRTDAIEEEAGNQMSDGAYQWTQTEYPAMSSTKLPFSQTPLTPPDSDKGNDSPQSSRTDGDSMPERIPEKSQYGVIYGMNQWVPRPYPLRTYKLDSATHQLPTPPPEERYKHVPEQVLENHQSTIPEKMGQWRRQNYPLQPSKGISASRSTATSYRNDEELQPLDQHLVNEQSKTSDTKNEWVRQDHPFQHPTEPPVSQNYPTPQPVTDVTVSSVQPENKPQNRDTTETTAWRRQTYPLQSATEGSIVEQAREPSASERTTQAGENISAERPGDNGQPPNNSSMWNRRVYPLHKQPSGQLQQDNKQHDSSSNSWNRRTYPLHKQPSTILREDKQPEDSNVKWSRRVYPLHKQPSTLLREDRHEPVEHKDPWSRQAYPLHKSPSRNLEEDKKLARSANPWSRQMYPLMSPPSISNLQKSSPTPPPYQGQKAGHWGQESSEQLRERKQPITESDQWGRQAYPLRSPPSIPTLQRLPTQPTTPTEKQAEKVRSPGAGPVYIPKNIRATTDAKKYDAKGRTIVVCLDGTGDKFDSDNSNIVHLVSSLKKDDPSQVTYYQAGIGTYSAGGLSSGFSAAMDMAVGSGLGLHVRDAYHFLMHTYKEGDKICIFGFSRGAYTARCLAGMIHKVGLLPPRNIQQIDFAYEFYADATSEGWQNSDDFKKTFCIDVNVYFLGVFDSVASVGFIPRQLPLSSTPTSKSHYFRHAMALDERRAKFKICRHQSVNKDLNPISTAISAAHKLAHPYRYSMKPISNPHDDAPPEYSRHANDRKHNEVDYKIESGHDELFDTDVLEVWFLGAHADVGGGAEKNIERHKLAQIPLRWMIRQCFECNTGIIFKTKVLAEHGIDVHMLWPKYEKPSAPLHGAPPSVLEKYEKGLPPKHVRTSKLLPTNKHEKGEPLYDLQIYEDDGNTMHDDWTPEHVEDFFDAMSRVNDQLVQAPTWWILEAWPVESKFFKPKSNEVYTKVGMNMGRYRAVEDIEPNLHWTVRHRMHHTDYKIQARTSEHATWRTVV